MRENTAERRAEVGATGMLVIRERRIQTSLIPSQRIFMPEFLEGMHNTTAAPVMAARDVMELTYGAVRNEGMAWRKGARV